MSSSLLTEYRCTCGKMLFKGLLCQGIVEIKCRRCAAVTTWGLAESLSYALLESDADHCLVSATGNTEEVLGYSRDYLIGRSLAEVFPLIRDAATALHDQPGNSYDLKNTVFMLHDGKARVVDSCVAPRYQDGSFVGYRIFSVPERS